MNKKSNKFRVVASNTTNTFVYCFIAAKRALVQAQKEREGRLYSCMTAGLFTAFSFEAYLNHIGKKKIKSWDAIERKLSPREKLLLLSEILSLKTDQSKIPFQTLSDIYKLRDFLAHGKTQTVSIDKVVEAAQIEEAEYPQGDWKKLCSLQRVTKMFNDVESMIRSINEQLGIKRDPFGSPEGGWSEEIGLDK